MRGNGSNVRHFPGQSPGGGGPPGTESLKALFVVLALALLGLGGLSATYTVPETQQAIVLQFGQPVGKVSEPGLHFKLPFAQDVRYIEKRILEWDGRPNQIPPRDKKYIRVDTTARWRIVDPLRYLQSLKSEQSAQGRLDDIIDSATRDVVSDNNLVEMVRDSNRILDVRTSTLADRPQADVENEIRGKIERIEIGRSRLQEAIAKRAGEIAPQYGIELVDVKVKRINYEGSVQKKVFDRMISERQKVAERIRSEGIGRKAEIAGQTERELRGIRSDAYRQAEALKGAADAKATAIYARAYGKDRGFYEFVQSLQSYKKTLGAESVLILSTDSKYLRHLTEIKR